MLRTLLLAAAAPVVGGSQVADGQWPDAVAVLGTSGTCTGTLVAPDVVLTAGHCSEIGPTHVVIGATSYTDGGQRIAVASVAAYPDWQTSYDVAAVVLAAPVAGIAPRALATSCTYDGFVRGSAVHLVGYGSTDATGTAGNTLLREAMANVTDPECTSGHGCRAALAPGGEFVAGGDGVNSCFGDSGGPVYLDTPRGTFAIGAVSRGVDGASSPCAGGGIYVRTDRIADWLEEQTGRSITRDDCTPDPKTASAGCDAGGAACNWAIGLLGLTGCMSRRDRTRKSRAIPSSIA